MRPSGNRQQRKLPALHGAFTTLYKEHCYQKLLFKNGIDLQSSRRTLYNSF